MTLCDCEICSRPRRDRPQVEEFNCYGCGKKTSKCGCSPFTYAEYEDDYDDDEKPPKVHFHGATNEQLVKNKSKRFLAVELEIAGVKEQNSYQALKKIVKNWGGAIVGDGSLPPGGFEINTAPANGDLFLKELREITKELHNLKAFVNKQCGLHIHVDARDYSYYDLRKLIILYAHIEPVIFGMVSKSRKKSHYCEPCGQEYISNLLDATRPEEIKKTIDSNIYDDEDRSGFYRFSNIEYRKKSKYDEARYKALNLHSWFYRGTVECRVFGGSTNYTKITSWAVMWAQILDYVKEHNLWSIKKIVKLEPSEALLTVIKGKRLKEWVVDRKDKFSIKSKNIEATV